MTQPGRNGTQRVFSIAESQITVSLSSVTWCPDVVEFVRFRLCMSMEWMNECVDMLFIIRVA
jgi:hypothetical protein